MAQIHGAEDVSILLVRQQLLPEGKQECQRQPHQNGNADELGQAVVDLIVFHGASLLQEKVYRHTYTERIISQIFPFGKGVSVFIGKDRPNFSDISPLFSSKVVKNRSLRQFSLEKRKKFWNFLVSLFTKRKEYVILTRTDFEVRSISKPDRLGLRHVGGIPIRSPDLPLGLSTLFFTEVNTHAFEG